MIFKIQANIVMSKDLTIEAENLSEAMQKAQEQMQGKLNLKEFTPSDLTYRLVSHAIGDHGLVENKTP